MDFYMEGNADSRVPITHLRHQVRTRRQTSHNTLTLTIANTGPNPVSLKCQTRARQTRSPFKPKRKRSKQRSRHVGGTLPSHTSDHGRQR